jgi:hypothetical protein
MDGRTSCPPQPFICFCLVFDNVVMATTGIDRRRDSTQAMLAFHACVTPLLLLVCYELAYLVHKQKSVNFCGISFESGHRQRHPGARDWLSTLLRFAVWLIGAGLLALNLLAAYRWSADLNGATVSSIYELQGDSTAHAVFAVLPALVLVALSLYIGLQLWNYGTFYSFMVHATMFNPWIWMLVGSLSLLAGYLLPSPLYEVSSHAGELVMMASIVRMFREVHHDMQQGQQMRNFIDPVRASPSPRRAGRDLFTRAKKQQREASSEHSHASNYHLNSINASGGSLSVITIPTAAGGANGEYMELSSPKEAETRLTDDDRNAQAGNFLSVVVASSRMNPLYQ